LLSGSDAAYTDEGEDPGDPAENKFDDGC